jgi:N6-adenosine-specific RNA methylase IME4
VSATIPRNLLAKRGTVIAPNTLTRREWVKRISEKWKHGCGNMIDTIFEVGRDLIAAKSQLERGEFMKMVGDARQRGELPFMHRVANMFMKIAYDQRLVNSKTFSNLPPYYATIHQITRLDDDTLQQLIRNNVIHPTCKYSDITKELRLTRVARDRARVARLVPVDGKFSTLIVDPPWDYEGLSVGGASKPGYATVTHEELLKFDLNRWAAPQCHLYLWTTNNFLLRAAELIKAWGFGDDYKTMITWIKTDKSAKVRQGLGNYFCNTTEHVLFATRGGLGTATKQTPTHFMAPVGRHSEKPEEFYEIVRRESPMPAGEIFQRKKREGFVNVHVDPLQMAEAAE